MVVWGGGLAAGEKSGKKKKNDPDPVGSVAFWPAGSGTFFIGAYM